MKKVAGDVILLHVCKSMTYFTLFFPLTTPKTKIWKNAKNMHRYYPLCNMSKDHMMHDSWDIRCDKQIWWKNEKITQRYYHFTLVYHKRWSFYVWFLRYKVWQTDEMKKWEKSTWKYYHFTLVYHKRWSMIIWCMVPEISSVADKMFCQFGLLFTL